MKTVDKEIHIRKKVAGGTAGVVLGATIAGPVGALVGGVIGTVVGGAAENGKLKKLNAAINRNRKTVTPKTKSKIKKTVRSAAKSVKRNGRVLAKKRKAR